jgi:hypothetical protein
MEERFVAENGIDVRVEFPVTAIDDDDGSTVGETKQHGVQAVGDDHIVSKDHVGGGFEKPIGAESLLFPPSTTRGR